MTENNLTLGLVQFSPAWENPAGSIEKLDILLNNLNPEIDVLIFPELSLTGFTFNSKNLAEDIDGISTKYFINLAIQHKKHILAGIIEQDGKSIYNSLIHVDSNGLIQARYRKVHPFSFAGEEKYYTASNQPIVTKIKDWKVGLSICYDLRFPELYRKYAKEKAELLINIANWPIKRITHWDLLTQARALENLSFFIGVNRVGSDPSNGYNGHSKVIKPDGTLVASFDEQEGILISKINKNDVDSIRNNFSFLEDIKLL